MLPQMTKGQHLAIPFQGQDVEHPVPHFLGGNNRSILGHLLVPLEKGNWKLLLKYVSPISECGYVVSDLLT